MDYTCPLCGDFEGSAESVQAHISSKNDEAHKGQVGKGLLTELKQQSGQNQQKKDRPGKAEGEQGELPSVECSRCEREVKYPELMPQTAKCPGCGKKMYKSSAFSQTEKQADEPGNDETKGKKTV